MADLLDYDPLIKRKRNFHILEGGDDYAVESQFDVTDIIEQNKALYNSVDERARHRSEVFNRVASLPLAVYVDLQNRGILDDEKAFRKWLDDPENRHFRTRPGKLSR